MKLVVGLGNYPKEYENTRHNVGFMVIDQWLKKHDIVLTENNFKGHYIKFKNQDDEDWIVAKPYTYMNLSGEFVRSLIDFYKIDVEDILIILDDVDLPVGTWRVKKTGSSGGQKGMQSIINLLAREDIKRIKIGIGRPTNGDIVKWVTSKFSPEERKKVQPAILKSVDFMDELMSGTDFEKAVSKFNAK
ncbi:MAG: aminoacyl-tRNA hydrolase [Malacoplasma sp.]|nr:aminoacyl-tRNA hydrolase [Malacoplasma sp.]